MLRYLLKRLLLTLPALRLVLTLVFLMIHTPDRAVGGLSFMRLR
jgi:ABC-type microcin C transport system permease subunit YejB